MRVGMRVPVGVTGAVRVRVSAVGVAVIVEEEEADDVGREAEAADDDDEFGRSDFGGVEEAFDGFHEDREAQRCIRSSTSDWPSRQRGRQRTEEEDAVDQGAEDFGSLPAVRVVLRSLPVLRELDGVQRDDEGADCS